MTDSYAVLKLFGTQSQMMMRACDAMMRCDDAMREMRWMRHMVFSPIFGRWVRQAIAPLG